MGRVASTLFFTLLFAAAVFYLQQANPEPIPINLGMLAQGQRPQLYLFEIVLFPALILFVLAFFHSLPYGKGRDQKRALEATQAQLREQQERLTALEVLLRTVGMLPVPGEDQNPATDSPTGESRSAAISGEEIPADDAPRVRVSRAIK